MSRHYYYNPRKNFSCGEPRNGTITSDPKFEKFKNESERTVFELTGKSGKIITCVAWGIHLIEKGENVTVFGFEKENNVFIAQKLIKNYELME